MTGKNKQNKYNLDFSSEIVARLNDGKLRLPFDNIIYLLQVHRQCPTSVHHRNRCSKRSPTFRLPKSKCVGLRGSQLAFAQTWRGQLISINKSCLNLLCVCEKIQTFSPTNGNDHVNTSMKFGSQYGWGEQLNCLIFITLFSYFKTAAWEEKQKSTNQMNTKCSMGNAMCKICSTKWLPCCCTHPNSLEPKIS